METALFFKMDTQANITFFNEFAELFFGFSQGEIIGRNVIGTIVPEIGSTGRVLMELVRDVLVRPERYLETEIENIKKTGERMCISWRNRIIYDSGGNFSGILCLAQDITECERASASLSFALEDARLFAEVRAKQERASFFANALESSSQPFASVHPNGRMMIFNQAFTGLTGYKAEELRSMTWAVDLTSPEWREHEAKVLEELRRTGEPQIYEKEFIRKDGARVLIEIKIHLMRDEKGNPDYYYAFLTDITERKRMEEEMKHLAHHDALTGLPNKMLFTDILARSLAQAQRHQTKLAILFLDLDRFKYINDTLGHDIGDKLLKEVAERLKNSIRGSDTVSRIGGDEFNILLSDITSVDDASVIPRKILAAFQKPYTIAGHEIRVTTSIGISIYPDDSEDLGTLLKHADIAMYHAKEHGGNIYQFYSAAINISSSERIQMENSLHQALERDELVLHYQPQANIDTRQVLCAEALVRWRHPEQGMLGPMDFIPLAEETGFIIAIDQWVLRTACKQFKEWQETGLLKMGVTVNLSAKQFQKADFVERLTEVLDETGLEPDRLQLEITESTAMKSLEHTIPSMNRLAEIGVGISIDDFGTGYSSLSSLKKLPIQKLKIDKSFIQDIATNPDDRAIVSAVTAMARNMKLTVVAEGVETEEQVDFLKSVGCQEMQGFLFSRPLPAEEFRQLMAEEK
jgi:diguanylate cyclase (GGDEF)-like protein/PAS domain S-box-containing protein